MKAAIAILALAIFARADTVELKTGEKIEGRFKQATDAGVVIEVGGQPITFGMDKVRAIYLGAAPAPVSQRAESVYSDAIDALKALQSVASSTITLRDYSTRVVDARVRVDRDLSRGGGAPAPEIRAAMRFYELASELWSTAVTAHDILDSITGNTKVVKSLMGDPNLMDCHEIDAIAKPPQVRSPPLPGYTAENELISHLRGKPQILWVCASAKIADAEAVLKPR